MRTTVVIDETLLKKAREALGTDTIRETIERALEEAVRSSRRQKLLALLGTLDLSLTPERLERWRSENEHLESQS